MSLGPERKTTDREGEREKVTVQKEAKGNKLTGREVADQFTIFLQKQIDEIENHDPLLTNTAESLIKSIQTKKAESSNGNMPISTVNEMIEWWNHFPSATQYTSPT